MAGRRITLAQSELTMPCPASSQGCHKKPSAPLTGCETYEDLRRSVQTDWRFKIQEQHLGTVQSSS